MTELNKAYANYWAIFCPLAQKNGFDAWDTYHHNYRSFYTAHNDYRRGLAFEVAFSSGDCKPRPNMVVNILLTGDEANELYPSLLEHFISVQLPLESALHTVVPVRKDVELRSKIILRKSLTKSIKDTSHDFNALAKWHLSTLLFMRTQLKEALAVI
jgi:hypothetical protein